MEMPTAPVAPTAVLPVPVTIKRALPALSTLLFAPVSDTPMACAPLLALVPADGQRAIGGAQTPAAL